MEDLIPFLIFIVIAVINVIKFAAEKGGRNKPTTQERPSGTPPRRQPTSIEEFFEEIAEKFEPKTNRIPDWPEAHERPDYIKEMEAYEQAQAQTFEQMDQFKIVPEPEPVMEAQVIQRHIPKEKMAHAARSPISISLPAMRRMNIPTGPMLKQGSAGIDINLKSKKKLRQAIIANLIFNPPRAYDENFTNTLTP